MFRKLLTFDEAKNALSQLELATLGTEEIPLLEAYNRILSEDAVSTLDIPPFNRSTVDGYAVKAEDTYGAEENQPVHLMVSNVVNIGEIPNVKIEKGEASEIVTGAPIPEGVDAVVMVEDTERENDDLSVFSSVTKNENVMKKGTDLHKGETALKAGHVLGPSQIGVLAALGMAKVKVFVVPKVAVLSTGSEVTEPGKPLPPGKIYDINAYSLSTAVTESGGEPMYMGVVPDEKAKLRETLEHALANADMVITSAGVSVGPKDLLPQTVDSLGKPGLLFSGVAVKPGKPTTAASIGKKLVFSLPGHPASALLMFHLLVRPVIQRLSGRASVESASVKAVAGARMFSAKGRRTFVMVKLKRDESKRLMAEPVESGASGAITTLARADGCVEIPENQQFVDRDDEVTVVLFRSFE
ncbi:MAG TPA: gephyrin-like molybdotransferase Glp [Candidatus Bathyarchaeia archaeon]|nr:gephyrin-like molybdotransferase Glp [Candidatus Bathyarchaeia archaeon]